MGWRALGDGNPLKFEEGMHQHSLEALYRKHYGEILSFFRRRWFSHEDSEDLTQRVFTNALANSDGLRAVEKFRSWILEVAKNVGINELARRAAARRGDNPWLESLELAEAVVDSVPSPLSQALSREQLQRVHEEIRQLPRQQRAVLLLCYFHEYSSLETAKILNLKPETVRSHLHDARQRLRKRLLE